MVYLGIQTQVIYASHLSKTDQKTSQPLQRKDMKHQSNIHQSSIYWPQIMKHFCRCDNFSKNLLIGNLLVIHFLPRTLKNLLIEVLSLVFQQRRLKFTPFFTLSNVKEITACHETIKLSLRVLTLRFLLTAGDNEKYAQVS